MKNLPTMSDALKKMSTNHHGQRLNNDDVLMRARKIYNDAKLPGKIVGFDGTDARPTILVAVEEKHLVEVPLTKAKLFSLQDYLNKLIQSGKVV